MAESRLTRRTIKQGKKQLYWSIAGIFIIIFAALNFGPMAIAALGNTIDAISGKNSDNPSVSINSDLKPPVLDPLPQAVSEENITISGTSFYSEGQIELYVNGTSQKSVELKSQSFEIKDVKLKSGNNQIKATIKQNDRESDFSENYEISYLQDEPELEISNPNDGDKFEKADREIVISGKTEPENTVTVNGFIAIVNSSGNFTYNMRLSDGDNKIVIIAKNPAEKTSEKEINVSYSE